MFFSCLAVNQNISQDTRNNRVKFEVCDGSYESSVMCNVNYLFSVMRDVAYVNHTAVISQNPKVTAINSCIEVDLTGQVVSDSIGTKMYSGISAPVLHVYLSF